MSSHIYKFGLCVVVVMVVLCSACLVAPGSGGNKPPVISSLEAQYPSVYFKGNSEIKCVASDPEGDAVQLTWSSTGGSLIGEGSTVIWQAPDDYGDYHIMVIASDKNGGSAEAALTISVIPRPYGKSCCGR